MTFPYAGVNPTGSKDISQTSFLATPKAYSYKYKRLFVLSLSKLAFLFADFSTKTNIPSLSAMS
ncbi:hypothetical protein TPENAI_70285 [Tenacibaculum litopenaei]|jgi:hypothetical protein